MFKDKSFMIMDINLIKEMKLMNSSIYNQTGWKVHKNIKIFYKYSYFNDNKIANSFINSPLMNHLSNDYDLNQNSKLES